jgi:hypothetical protein
MLSFELFFGRGFSQIFWDLLFGRGQDTPLFNLVSEIAQYATHSQFFREAARCIVYGYQDFQSDGDANIDSCHSPKYAFHS